MELRPILSALWRSKTAPILVAAQVALSLALLVNAAHIINLRLSLAARPSGVSDEASVFHIDVSPIKRRTHQDQDENLQVQRAAARQQQAIALRAMPGVVSVSQANQSPLSGGGWRTLVGTINGKTNTKAAMYITPDSLIKTWGLKLIDGRDFTSDDVPEASGDIYGNFPKAVIITKALATQLWPGSTSAVGKTMYFFAGEHDVSTRVVGVVERLQTLDGDVGELGEYSTILPRQLFDERTIYIVRVENGANDRVIKEMQTYLHHAATDPVLVEAQTVLEDRKQRYRADLALSWMLITISALLLLITASSIVGMASLWVTQRRKQIGVRRALGARRIDILRYFISENILITSAGVGFGVMLAIGLNQLLVRQLEMSQLPLAYLVGGAVMFWLLGIIAVFGPAWRAASISPALATRSA